MTDFPVSPGGDSEGPAGAPIPAPVDFPTSPGGNSEGPSGAVIPAPVNFPVSPGGNSDWASGMVLTAFVRNETPIGPLCVDGTTVTPSFEVVTNLPDTIDLSNLTVTVTYGATTETVFTAGAFVAPYNTSAAPIHTVTALEDYYSFVITRTGGWPPVTVFTFDVSGTTIGLVPYAETWSWCTLPSVVPPVTYDCDLYPKSGSYRGGTEVAVYAIPGVQLRTTAYDEPMLSPLYLPSSFDSAHAGGKDIPTREGLILESTQVIGALARIETKVAYALTNFDVAVDVRVLSPARSRSGLVDLAVLRFEDPGGEWIRVGLTMGGRTDTTAVTAQAAYYQEGEIVRAGALELNYVGVQPAGFRTRASAPVTLRLVRCDRHVWAFVGQRDRDGNYTSLTKLLDWDLWVVEDAGTVALEASNLGTRENVRSRFTNYTVRSHAILGTRLLDSKIDAQGNRVVGDAPAVPIEEIGDTDLTLFGLFGLATHADAFEYILPQPRTLGANRTIDARTYQDAQIRDIEE